MKNILIITLAAGLFFISNHSANAQKYSASDMPKAVIESFNKMFPSASAIGYDIEKENGGKFYEIESKEGDIRRDLLFNEDGSINEIEEHINVSDLPANIINGINAKYPKGTITRAEKVTNSSETLYEVIVKTGKKKLEVRLNTNGEIISTE